MIQSMTPFVAHGRPRNCDPPSAVVKTEPQLPSKFMTFATTLEDEVLDASLGALKDSQTFPDHLVDLLVQLREAGQLSDASRLFEIFTQERDDAPEVTTPER